MNPQETIDHVQAWAEANGIDFKVHSLVGIGLRAPGLPIVAVRNRGDEALVFQHLPYKLRLLGTFTSLDGLTDLLAEHLILPESEPELDGEEEAPAEPLAESTEEAPADGIDVLLSHSIQHLEAELATGAWDGQLDAILAAELAGKDRKGAKKAIAERQEQL